MVYTVYTGGQLATCSSIIIKFERIRHIDIYTLKYNFIAPDKV